MTSPAVSTKAVDLIDRSMADMSSRKLEDTNVVIDLLLDLRAILAPPEGSEKEA